MLNFYCSTKVKIRLDVAAKLLGRLKSSKSIDSVKKGWMAVILCLALVFPAAVLSVPQTVQADDGGYLLDKVVTWADGSTEHVQISDDGYFTLDGAKRRLVGMGMVYSLGVTPWWSPENLPLFDKELSFLESVGIRLVTMNPHYPCSFTAPGCEDANVSPFFDLIYHHKLLFIPHIGCSFLDEWSLAELNGLANPDFPISYWWEGPPGEHHQATDSYGAFAGRFADMLQKYPNIVAMTIENEIDKPEDAGEDWSPEVAANFVNYVASIFRARLNVPITHNFVGIPEQRPDIKTAVLPMIDHPGYDLYNSSFSAYETRLNTLVSWLSSIGYPTTGWWMLETNKAWPSDAAGFNSEWIESAFDSGAAIAILHCSNNRSEPTLAFFDDNGDPIPSLVAIGAEIERLQAPIVEPSSPPTVTTSDASNATNTGTTLNGNLSDLGSASTVDVSFHWGTSSGDYASETIPQTMDATGPFNFELTGLSPETAYYFRAKAVGDGTHYGDEKSFTTGSVNQPPVLNPIGDKSVNKGELLQFTIWATDPDDDPLTYSASDLPQGASFDPQTKAFSWTPDEAGTFPNVHFEVSDGELTDSEDITITVNAVSSPPSSGGGGGGGGGATKETTLMIDLEGALGEAKIQGLKGLLLAPLAVTSPDALITFEIALHTKALTSGGNVVNKIQMQKLAQPPPVPATYGIVGDAYEFTPAGTTFNPPANLTLTCDPSDIPEGIPEENLSIAYWDAATDKWVSLPSTVNPATHTVTAKVSHFTVFAIIGLRPPVANFKCSALTISPDKVGTGETVNVSISVSNVGGAAGSCKLTLKVDGVFEATKEVTADAGATKEVSFSIVKDTAGTYIVDVNSITGSFVVKAGPTPEISVFGVTPNYHGETHKLAFASVIYEVNNLYEAMADAELTLKVSLDSEPLEEVSLLSLSQLELGEITGSRDYIPPRGWKSGTYTFQAELYVGGKLYATTTEEEMEVSAPVVNWVTLGKIIGSALILIAVTVSAILLRRRRLLQRLGQR